MDINEVIQEYEELAEYWITKSYYLSYKYKQIAEWLKERKEITYNNETCLHIYRDGYEDGYRKAKENE